MKKLFTILLAIFSLSGVFSYLISAPAYAAGTCSAKKGVLELAKEYGDANACSSSCGTEFPTGTCLADSWANKRCCYTEPASACKTAGGHCISSPPCPDGEKVDPFIACWDSSHLCCVSVTASCVCNATTGCSSDKLCVDGNCTAGGGLTGTCVAKETICSRGTPAADAATCQSTCQGTCQLDNFGIKRCCEETEGICVNGTTYADGATCASECKSPKICENDTKNFARCCVEQSTCTSGSVRADEAACQSNCTGTCVADRSGVKRCCTSSTPPTDGGDETCPGGINILGICLGGSQSGCVEISPFGCIPTDIPGLAKTILGIGYGIGTLLAILFLIIGGYGVVTSTGDPEKLEKAKAQITAAVEGLVFLLLSVLILRIIGIDIIGLGSDVFPF